MLSRILGKLWRSAPKAVRRWGVWLAESRFTVTAGGVIQDAEGRILLLNHVFRKGSGWGIPGGFINRGEHPEEALRRELREETGMELSSVEIAFAHTHKRPHQVEIIFRCRAQAETARAQSLEIRSAQWFALDSLPPELPADQHTIIRRALESGRRAE